MTPAQAAVALVTAATADDEDSITAIGVDAYAHGTVYVGEVIGTLAGVVVGLAALVQATTGVDPIPLIGLWAAKEEQQ